MPSSPWHSNTWRACATCGFIPSTIDCQCASSIALCSEGSRDVYTKRTHNAEPRGHLHDERHGLCTSLGCHVKLDSRGQRCQPCIAAHLLQSQLRVRVRSHCTALCSTTHGANCMSNIHSRTRALTQAPAMAYSVGRSAPLDLSAEMTPSATSGGWRKRSRNCLASSTSFSAPFESSRRPAGRSPHMYLGDECEAPK